MVASILVVVAMVGAGLPVHVAAFATVVTTNLGIPVFDLAFGTYTSPDAAPRPKVGIADSPAPAALSGQLLFPFRQWRRRP